MTPVPIVGYGVNGDPLHEGKLDLPELLEVPAPDEWAWARDFIARRKWNEAVTYRKTAPHEYTVRAWEVGGQANPDFADENCMQRFAGGRRARQKCRGFGVRGRLLRRLRSGYSASLVRLR